MAPFIFYRICQEEFLEACESGNLDDVKSTLEKLKNEGNDVNVRDADGNSGLHLGAKKGHLPVVEFLFSEGTDVNATNNDKETALIKAAFFGHLEVCEYLVSNGADVTVKSKFGTAMKLAKKKGHDAIVDFLKSVM